MTNKDITFLKNSRKKSQRYFVPIFLLVAAAFNLVIGLWNLRLCARAAHYDNMTFSDVFNSWIEGVDIYASYSGVYLTATERLSSGALQLGVALTMVIFTITFILNNRRNRRILTYIESKESTTSAIPPHR